MAKRAPQREKFDHYFNGAEREVEIAPSILSADFAIMGRELGRCRRAKAPWIHIDVMDGHFVPNMTVGPPLIQCWRAAEPRLFFDAHLMIENPMRLADEFIKAGAQIITIHAEAARNASKDLQKLKATGVRVGISIKPATSVRAIKDCLAITDLVLVMTVEPGFGGQALIPTTLNKVRELDLLRRKQGMNFRLQVDGGINKKTAPLAVAAGADVLVAGSAVFNGSGSVSENLATLREAVSKISPKPKARRRRRSKKVA